VRVRFSPPLWLTSPPTAQLEEGAQLKLPIWLVKSLVMRKHVEVQLPKCYGPVWRNALRANAGHQDLGSQYENYFDVGVQLLELVDENELGDLGKELLTGFSSRFHGLLDAALNLTDQVSADAPAIGRPPRHAARRSGARVSPPPALATATSLRWPSPRPLTACPLVPRCAD
jgi:hypothetical protein